MMIQDYDISCVERRDLVGLRWLRVRGVQAEIQTLCGGQNASISTAKLRNEYTPTNDLAAAILT